MKTYARILIPLFVALAVAIGLSGHVQAYSQTRLMDDQVFNNSSSLTTGQVGDFLAGRTGPFVKLSSASPCLGSYNDQNFHWDGTKWHYGNDSDWNTGWGPAQIPASTVIAQTAAMWGINPEVIIATLQKEESLITGTSCDGWRYNSAMGYGCPDSGGCNPKYVGFTKQVLWGSWQLEFGEQRSYGNTGWDDDGSLTYVGYMTQGNRARCAGCTVNFYDGYASIDGQSVYMENGTTASLYSYTPHLGQSFPGIFESWFGPAVLSSYSASYVTQSAYPSLFPGQSTAGSFTYKNTGTANWYDDASASSNNALPVHLATSHPINRNSDFGSNRPSVNFAVVLDSNGNPYSSNPHIVHPGESARFVFPLQVPGNEPAGVYREYYQPIVEGTPTGSFADPGTYLDITVQNPTYTDAYAGQSAWPTITPGQSSAAFFLYRNTGNQPWYDNSSISGAPAGTYPLHLSTSHPINRTSQFGSWGNRPGLNFSAVYEADGTTLATNQHVVQPGQIGKYSFSFTVPANQPAGTYREFFMPIREGTSDGGMNDPGTYLDITVPAVTYSAAYAGQSAWPTIARGNSAAAFFLYRNSGNQPWYDNTSIGNAPAGNYPMHLATSHPINRTSLFGTWGNRPDLNFTAVYEADGTTLAADQHVVQPGQIAKYGFTFTVASNQPSGTYREFFMPIREGTSDGGMNDPGTYLDVTVP